MLLNVKIRERYLDRLYWNQQDFTVIVYDLAKLLRMINVIVHAKFRG